MNENQIIEFTNEQFGKIRTTLLNGEPWFVSKPNKSQLDKINKFRILAGNTAIEMF